MTALSVLQVMDAVRRVTGIDVEPERRDRASRRPRPHRRVRTAWPHATCSGRCGYDVDAMVASAWGRLGERAAS